jgi:predicted molibdopterin-dependent oxidoreductase YjgC
MRLTIDGVALSARDGCSVLDAARENDIYIPHLCSHPELSPYGGCRLCLIEVDGMPGCPAACMIPARDGMVVRTKTDAVQALRREVLQLMLSEHPASCLVCPEGTECASFQGTIRKVGVTTGCRYCPKDGVCELQAVARSLGVTELALPIVYRNLPVERDEEFYDRDYNLCIYCARCVRMCQEQRQAAVLSFRRRGALTTIGPAFDMSHFEAGCEFCGACVSVCPTGALSEKGRKWAGAVERFAPSVCPLCGEQCDIQVAVARDRVVGTLPPGDPSEAGGDLCVKGRFCLADLANHPDRLRVPTVQATEGREEVDWPHAATAVAERLKGISGERIAIYASPDLLLEDMVGLRLLMDRVLNTENVTTSSLAPGSAAIIARSSTAAGPQALRAADCIVSLFFQGNYGHAPITLAIKRAVGTGARYFQIGWLADPTSRFAERRVTAPPGGEAALVRGLVSAVVGRPVDQNELVDVAAALRAASRPMFVLGTPIAGLPEADAALAAIDELVALTGGTVLVPHAHANLPAFINVLRPKPRAEIDHLVHDAMIDVLWIVGEHPFDERPPVKTVIYQNTLPAAPALAPDVVLPAAAWCEVAGSLASDDGVSRRIVQAAVQPPALARHDHEIFTMVAEAMGMATASAPLPDDLAAGHLWRAAAMRLDDDAQGNVHPVAPPREVAGRTLVCEPNPHCHRGVAISDCVEDFARLAPQDTLLVNPADAAELSVGDGDSLTPAGGGPPYRVQLDRRVPCAFMYLLVSARSAQPGRTGVR